MQLFHQRKRKGAPQFLSPYYLFIVHGIYIHGFFLKYFFLTEKMENSFHLNSQSSHAQRVWGLGHRGISSSCRVKVTAKKLETKIKMDTNPLSQFFYSTL